MRNEPGAIALQNEDVTPGLVQHPPLHASVVVEIEDPQLGTRLVMRIDSPLMHEDESQIAVAMNCQQVKAAGSPQLLALFITHHRPWLADGNLVSVNGYLEDQPGMRHEQSHPSRVRAVRSKTGSSSTLKNLPLRTRFDSVPSSDNRIS